MKSKTISSIFILFGVLMLFSCKEEVQEELSEKIERVSIDEIEEGIKKFIADQTEKNGGVFPIKDENHDLKMKLVRVHTEYLSRLGPKSHFACVDLVDESGDVYDVDFFMEGDPGSMGVTATSVHKFNGKPYYSWKQNKEDKTWFKVAMAESNNRLLGVIEGGDEFTFYYSAQVPTLEGPAKMWIPISETDDFQQVELVSKKVPAGTREIREENYGNKLLFMELGPENSGEEITLAYHVKRKEKGPYNAHEPDVSLYLGSTKLMPTGGQFEQIAKETLGVKINDTHLIQARALYDYVIDNMKYAKVGDYGNGDSYYACDSKTGNCTEFHSLFISLARSVGIPSRFAIGASIPSDRDEGGIDGYHCWAEFYADGKWWPVDISEANKYTALATYYFGRHPANRIELSRGRDLKMTPSPEAGPINFLAYPYLEIDGKQVKVNSKFTFSRKNEL
ncbi:transglutaminase superfamily protein [Algoriphagus ratkowskyi]|uniref:Transglutaminase domain-containing protein n=1 Tax=Algoriphagus ratkowskyi TaxID=57028 RepID=A0A2W7RC27_9BACT|nr:transglutaminase-like domain-containing protein [Algoriphagus ratkowskyi]PZX58468.1 transglutaminase superfamily protein [Algoriphagus ratkowskyi]TXD77668.1 transglutaminase domain-containing protein [Algoriphagus ratkowskyi]